MRWIALGCVALVGCSHKNFQFRPSGSEEDVLRGRVTVALQAMEHGEAGTLKGITDAKGRGAILSVGADLAEAKSPELAQLRGALWIAALVLGHTAARHPEKLPRREQAAADWLRKELADRLGEDVAQELTGAKTERPSFGSIMKRIEAVRRDGDLDGELERITATRPAGCTYARPYVSYDLWLLRHVEWTSHESALVQAWKKDIRKLHLVEVSCVPPNEKAHGVMLFSDYGGDAAPLLVGWRFFTEEQWGQVRARIDDSLELK
jgi:hypothetical protein